ncbi:response regulator transcription factor [Pedobacter ginsengiterrae]|uniref:Response regulator transcription factor n=1 Tax=Pedobacter ginsengiterrae TaxID=871696 RepID=A0ABP7NMQ5_9SPHI
MKSINLYLADDHVMMVEGLKEILRAHTHLNILGTASNGEEIMALMNNRPADVIIMDINMPKMNGIQCTEWVKKHHPKTKVIVLTMFPEKSYIDQLITAGADGCLLKSRGSIDLIEAINRVSADKSYFDTIKEFSKPNDHPVYNLSEREIEIIRMVVNGMTSAEIADKLFLSEHTVKTHRKNIFRKTGINTVSQLTSFAINQQMLH